MKSHQDRVTTEDLEQRTKQLAEKLESTGHVVSVTGAVTEDVAADIFDVTTRTMFQWRQDGIGPKFHKVGQTTRYSLIDILRFIESGGTRRSRAIRKSRKNSEVSGS